MNVTRDVNYQKEMVLVLLTKLCPQLENKKKLWRLNLISEKIIEDVEILD